MITVAMKKGYDLPISGEPALKVNQVARPDRVASLPERIPFIKPRLQVKVGDHVDIGSVLFTDKQNPDLKFLSPGSGIVTEINFGLRRVIREIVVRLDAGEQYVDFPKVTDAEIRSLSKADLIQMLMQGGVWPLIRELPFRNIADPESQAAAIWVILGSREPFQTSPEIYLRGQEALFTYGLKILRRFGFPVQVVAPDSLRLQNISELITHRVGGKYPSLDPGVVVYRTKTSAAENVAWYLSGQDLLAIALLMKKGRYPVERITAVGGSRAKSPGHYQTRIGMPVAAVAPEFTSAETGIAGGVFTGYTVAATSYLGLYETALTCIARKEEAELFGFLRPGVGKHSYSRTFLSVFRKQAFDMDSGQHGEERACVNCGSCAKVCPVDILPQYTVKCLGADAIEEALAHGLLDCVECGLCSYVCPSKIEIREILQKARHAYYLEQQ